MSQLTLAERDENNFVPVEVTSFGSDVAQVSVGSGGTCVRTTAGALWCWGVNGSGEVGDGTTQPRGSPFQVTALGANVADVSVGDEHTCATTTDGTLWCWGENNWGQLGDGTTTDQHTPVRVTEFCP